MDAARFRAHAELFAWLVLAATFFVLSFRFSDSPGAYAWGPASWPRAVLLLIVLAAMANFFANRPGRHAGDAPEREERAAGTGELLSVLAMIAIPFVYVWLIPRAGFHVSTLLFLPAFMMHLGERRPAALVGVTLFLYVVLNLVFTRLFYVGLPTGNWPAFYEASNWLVKLFRM